MRLYMAFRGGVVIGSRRFGQNARLVTFELAVGVNEDSQDLGSSGGAQRYASLNFNSIRVRAQRLRE
jgi:hypothetical protein